MGQFHSAQGPELRHVSFLVPGIPGVQACVTDMTLSMASLALLCASFSPTAHGMHQRRGFHGLLQQYYDPVSAPGRVHNGEETWRNYTDSVTLLPMAGSEEARNASFVAAHQRITAQLLREAVRGELDATPWDKLPNTPVYDPVKWHRVRAASPHRADWPNSMAICAFMKGEDPEDVMEWLAYYRRDPPHSQTLPETTHEWTACHRR